MNNTVFFTPSQQQLREIAEQSPQLHQEIQSCLLTEIKASAIRAIGQKIQDKSNAVYREIYEDIEKKYFTAGNYWKNIPTTFGTSIRSHLENQIKEALEAEIEKEFQEYINGPIFKSSLRAKIREKVLDVALKTLDEQIHEEAKKLTA